ncbi:MAG: hypothetical protein NZM42_05090 [Gemmatales bacterium]|nr:hypothetical protein [Gemmatales bacterium]MDW8222678.1 hypothetical protein [Gemmatales bacterium]
MEDMVRQLVQVNAEAPGYVRYLLIASGVALIGTGWRAYRFWFAAAVTTVAGMWGLVYGAQYGAPPLVAGVLAAVGIGCIALAATRLVIFAAGGWISWQLGCLVIQEWANPLVCFLIGGILSTLLFRLVVRLVTGGVGVLLLGLGLHWVRAEGDMIIVTGWWQKSGIESASWVWLTGMFAAAFVQALIDKMLNWWQARRQEAKKKANEKKEAVAQAA